jgi:hypothetical protein
MGEIGDQETGGNSAATPPPLGTLCFCFWRATVCCEPGWQPRPVLRWFCWHYTPSFGAPRTLRRGCKCFTLPNARLSIKKYLFAILLGAFVFERVALSCPIHYFLYLVVREEGTGNMHACSLSPTPLRSSSSSESSSSVVCDVSLEEFSDASSLSTDLDPIFSGVFWRRRNMTAMQSFSSSFS